MALAEMHFPGHAETVDGDPVAVPPHPEMRRRRVVVTGIGVVTPFGHDVEGFWQALLAGRSCIAPITRLDTSDFPVHFGGQVDDVAATPFLPASLIRRNDLSTNIGLLAGGLALESAGLGVLAEQKRAISVMVGSAFGATQGLQDVYNTFYLRGWRKMHPLSVTRNDATETQALRAAFGHHAGSLAVSANKSMLGHTMGASGALELVATLLTLRDGIIPPTINYCNPDPACDLDYVPNQARRRPVRLAIKNSFAFGGENAVLVVRKTEETPQ